MRNKLSQLKTLVLKLKPSSLQPDLSSLNFTQLDPFFDEIIADLRGTFANNISNLHERVKRARPNPTDPNHDTKMKTYQQLLSDMVPMIQLIQKLTVEILDELHALINSLWDDICKNNGKGVDRLLEEHMHRTEAHINRTFSEPISALELKLKEIRQIH